MGACSGPVWVRTRLEQVLKMLATLNLELDHRSGSSQGTNLEPNYGQVWLGSGSNQGSEPNLTIPNATLEGLASNSNTSTLNQKEKSSTS
jgi:hypothetical protein